MPGDVTLTFDAVLSGTAKADISNIKKQLDALTKRVYKIKISVDDTNALKQIANMSIAVSNLQKSLGAAQAGVANSPIGNISSSFLSMQKNLESVRKTLSKIGRQNLGTTLDFGSFQKEGVEQYVSQVKGYVSSLGKAYSTIKSFQKIPAWNKSLTDDIRKQFNQAIFDSGDFDQNIKSFNKRLASVTTFSGAQNVARDAEKLWAPIEKVMSHARSIGILGKQDLTPLFPEIPKGSITNMNDLVQAMTGINLNVNKASVGAQTITSGFEQVQQSAQSAGNAVQQVAEATKIAGMATEHTTQVMQEMPVQQMQEATNIISQQAKTAAKNIQHEFAGEKIKVGIELEEDAHAKATAALEKMGISENDIQNVLGSAGKTNMSIDKIKTTYADANEEAQQFVNTTINGHREIANGLRENIALTKTYDNETGEAIVSVQNREVDIAKYQKEQAKAYADQIKAQRDLVADYYKEYEKNQDVQSEIDRGFREKRAKEQADEVRIARDTRKEIDDYYAEQDAKELSKSKARAQQQKKQWEDRQKWLKEVDKRGRLPEKEVTKTTDDIKRLQSQAASMERSLINKPLGNTANQEQALKYIRSMREEMDRFPGANKAMTDHMQSRMDNVSKMVDGYRQAESMMKNMTSSIDKTDKTFKTLNTDNIDPAVVNQYADALKNARAAVKELDGVDLNTALGAQKADNARVAIENLGTSYGNVAQKINEAKNAQKEIDRQINSSERAVESYSRKYENLNTGVLGENDTALENYAKNLERVKTLTEQARDLSPADPNYKNVLADLKNATNTLGQSYDTLARKIKIASAEQKEFGRQATSVQGQIQKVLDQNQNLAGTTYASSLQGIMEEIQGKKDSGHRFSTAELADYRTQIEGITKAAADAGKMGKTMGQTVVGLFKKFGGWQLVTHSMMRAIQTVKDLISNVRQLDAAMVELKKVTDESDSTYAQFFEQAKTRAKTIGATLTDTISASADFARLGYDITDSANLADVALTYKNVGDGIDSIDEASQSVISTMKAFGIETQNSYSIVDKFNEVGNNFAISSKGIGDALTRSASALAAGNNTLDESIALITAGNEVVQDPEKMGTVMKTLSMYLRSAKTEAEDAGVETDGMADSVSKLRGELLSLTGGRVDIQLDEDTFKSTYQIMKELSGVWDDLSDITRANILERIGGKRNANVTAAILKNFATAEKVVETSANSAGSAMAENEKYLNSINGKIAQFEASWQSLSATMLSTDLFKNVVSGATSFVNVIDTLATKFGSLPVLIGGVTAALSAYRLKQTGRTGILDFVTNKDGNRSVRLFNHDLAETRDTIKDIYNTSLGGKTGFRGKTKAGFQTIGGIFGATLLGSSSQITEHKQLLETYKQTQKIASQFKGHDASGTLSQQGQKAAENFNKAKEALMGYNTQLQFSSSYWANYVKSVGVENASFKGFIENLRTTNQLGAAIGEKFKNLGVNIASMFGSAFISAGISLAVQAVITGISKLITYEEDLRKKTLEASKAYSDSSQSLTNYAAEISQLQTSLSTGTLSIDETISARQRLIAIQGELQSQYGAEADGLNLLAASAEQTTEAINRLAEAQANAFLVENEKGIKQAEREMSQSRQFGKSFDMPDSKELKQQLMDLAGEFDSIDIFSGSGMGTTPRITFQIEADVNTAIEELTEFKNKAHSLGIDLSEIVSSNMFGGSQTLADYITETLGEYQKIQAKYGETDLEAINAKIAANKDYRNVQEQITEAQNGYNEALFKSYDSEEARREAIAKSISNIQALQSAIDSVEFDPGDTNVKNYLQDLYDTLNKSIAEEQLKLDIELDVDEGETSDKLSNLKNVLKRFSDGQGKVTVKAIFDAEMGDPAAWNALNAAAADYGVTIEQLLPILADAGMIIDSNSDLAYNAAAKFSELSSSTTAIADQQSALNTALQEQASNGTITLDTYNALIATSKDFANTLEFEAGAMKINGEMAQNLIEAKTKEQVAEMQLAKSEAIERYKQNAKAIEEAERSTRRLTDAEREKRDANLARWKSENETIMDTVNKYNILIDQLQRATGAYAQWQNAKQTENSDSIYKNLVSAKKDIDDALKSGQTGKGNDDYTAAIKLLVPEGKDVKEYRDKVLNSYLQLDDDGGLKFDGLNNFLNDAIAKGLMYEESDGAVKVAANKMLQDFIDEMEITPELAKSIFDALETYDFEFDFSDEEFLDAQSIDMAKRRVSEYQDQLDGLKEDYEEIQNNKDLTPEARTEQLDEVQQKIDEISTEKIITEVQADTAGLSEGEAALEAILRKQEEIDGLKSKPGVDPSEIEQAEHELALLQQYIDNLSEEEIKLTVSGLKENIDTSIKTMDSYIEGSDSWNEARDNLSRYIQMLDMLPDEVKTEYGISAEYEESLRAVLEGRLTPKELILKVKVEAEIDKAKDLVTRAGEAIKAAMSNIGGANSDAQGTITVDADTGPAETKIATLSKSHVTVDVEVNLTQAQAQIASLQAEQAVNILVTADPYLAQAQINSLQATPVIVNVTANTTVAEAQIAALAARLAGSNPTVTVNYSPDTSALPTRFSSLSRTVNYVANTSSLPTSFTPITRTVRYVSTGDTSGGNSGRGPHDVNGTANALGTALAGGNWGTKTGGMTLVGELGRKHFATLHSDVQTKNLFNCWDALRAI